MPRAPGRPGEEPEQAAVHRVGARGGEGDLVAADPEALGDHLARVVQHQPCRPGRAVQAARVGVPLVERGEQDLAGGRVQRLGGRGVEVGGGTGRGPGPGVPEAFVTTRT